MLSVTEPPVHKLSVPDAEILAFGRAFIVSVRVAVTEQPAPFEIVHV